MRKITISAILIFALILTSGCNAKPSNAEVAKAFTEKVLTAPYKEIYEVEKLNLPPEDSEEYFEKFNEAVKSLCGDVITEELLTAPGSMFYNSIIMLHAMAVDKDFTYTVESVEIDEGNGKQLSYIAVVNASNEEEKVTIYGRIQFNDDDKIDFMTMDKTTSKILFTPYM